MKKKMLSLVAAVALLLAMVPMAFTVSASTADEFKAGSQTLVVRNFEQTAEYGPWGADVWYNPDLTNKVYCTPGKGLYFAAEGVAHGSANIKIDQLTNNNLSEATYLVLTFCKNSLAAGSTFRIKIEFNLGSNYVLKNNTEILYDNGAAELQTSTAQGGDVWSREIELTVGTADTITAYVPMNAIVFAYNESATASVASLKAAGGVGINFIDLGNKTNALLANSEAISVKEISMLVPKKAIDECTAGMKKTVVQNLEVYEPWGANVWYNADLTDVPACAPGKGLFFSDGGKAHGTANIKINTLANRNISKATYVALTFCKNGLAVGSTFRIKLGFTLDSDYVLANGTTVYYSNGAAEMQTAVAQGGDVWSREMEFTVGTANTITAYVPVDAIVFAYGGAPATEEALQSVGSIGVNFVDLGNKTNALLANTEAVSLKEISMFALPSFEILGAGARDNDQIRFGLLVEDKAWNGEEAVEYGTLMIPTNILGSEELTLDTVDVLNVPTAKWQDALAEVEGFDGDLYTAVLTGVTEPEREITARGYMRYQVNSEWRVRYTDAVVRSIGGVYAAIDPAA